MCATHDAYFFVIVHSQEYNLDVGGTFVEL